jgi:hypothetical protein
MPPAGAAAGLVAESDGLSAGLADEFSDFFLQPPTRHREMVSNTVQLFIDEAFLVVQPVRPRTRGESSGLQTRR